MDEAQQASFVTDLVVPPKEELPEATGLLDLAEHRLDGDLAQAVSASAATAPEPALHHRGPAAGLAAPASGGRTLAMALAPYGNIALARAIRREE